MNYRHAFHAGNFADCVKHALLLWLLGAMRRKDKPFLVLDTHAGAGRYDLTSGAAAKTGEWRGGIGRVLEARPAALVDFCAMIEELGLYPGSPAISASALRPGDRLVCCELHPEDAGQLKAALAGRPGAAVHERDGYEALRTFLPPPEKRGLILIDPPFERPDEFLVAVKSLSGAYEKFKTGVYVVWYPIKSLARVRDFCESLKLTKLRDVVTAELWQREPTDPARLNGCGLAVVNPPFGFEAAARPILRALVDIFGEAGAGCDVKRLIDE